jgi:predicted dehydrogenase
MKPPQAASTFKGKEERPLSAKPVAIATEDAATILLEFDNGATGLVAVSQVSAGRKNREWFEIDGSKSAIAWDQEEPNQLWIGHRERPNEVLIKDPSLLHERARAYAHYPGGHPEGYPDGPKNLFLNFYGFIREGKDPARGVPPFPTFEDGHRENCVVEAVLASHRKRGWVRVK